MTEASGEVAKVEKGTAPPPKPRNIHSCNFRYAGRLSNENARTLTALHEKFALSVSNSVGLYLGTSLHLKLAALEQVVVAEYSSRTPVDSYLVPCSLNVMDTNILLEMDIDLIFPIIDLLLGGAGTASEEARELTDIDEEILQSVTVLTGTFVAGSEHDTNTKPLHQTRRYFASVRGQRKTGAANLRNDLGEHKWVRKHRSADIVGRLSA
jgi:flagellar motor switch protein FliM